MKIAESCRPWALAALAQDGLLPSIHAKHSWAQQKAPPPRSDGYGFLGRWKDMIWIYLFTYNNTTNDNDTTSKSTNNNHTTNVNTNNNSNNGSTI
jgi:hypothetical protein